MTDSPRFTLHGPDENGNCLIAGTPWSTTVIWRSNHKDDTESVARDVLAVFQGGVVLDAPPEGTEYHLTAPGAWLIEHDPDGEVWEREVLIGNWRRGHAASADPEWHYLIRRRPVPAAPATVKVPLHELFGKRLVNVPWRVQLVERADSGFVAVSARNQREPFLLDADGMIEVLPDSDTGADR